MFALLEDLPPSVCEATSTGAFARLRDRVVAGMLIDNEPTLRIADWTATREGLDDKQRAILARPWEALVEQAPSDASPLPLAS